MMKFLLRVGCLVPVVGVFLEVVHLCVYQEAFQSDGDRPWLFIGSVVWHVATYQVVLLWLIIS